MYFNSSTLHVIFDGIIFVNLLEMIRTQLSRLISTFNKQQETNIKKEKAETLGIHGRETNQQRKHEITKCKVNGIFFCFLMLFS